MRDGQTPSPAQPPQAGLEAVETTFRVRPIAGAFAVEHNTMEVIINVVTVAMVVGGLFSLGPISDALQAWFPAIF